MAGDPREVFRSRYVAQSDPELLQLASDAPSYIRIAREELTTELARRGLPNAGVSPPEKPCRLVKMEVESASLPPGFSTTESSPARGCAKIVLGIVVLVILALLSNSGMFGYVPALIISAPLLLLSSWLLRRGHRELLPEAATILAKDPRKPILYLRPFRDDDEKGGGGHPFFSHPKTREAKLVRSLKHIGPVVALSNPQYGESSFGAARLVVDAKDWQQRFYQLLAMCRLVILRVGDTPGVAWEMEQIVAHLPPERVVLQFPLERVLKRSRQGRYEFLAAPLNKVLPQPLPPKTPDSNFIRFTADWTAVPFGSCDELTVDLPE